MEAFVNFIASMFKGQNGWAENEIMFLNDEGWRYNKGEMEVVTEYHRLEEKMKLLMKKFTPDFDYEHNPNWAQFVEFKKFRDAIMHPRADEDETSIAQYEGMARQGLRSTIELIDALSQGIFRRHLRQGILDLRN